MQTNGVTLRVLEAGQPGAPAVVLLHGFPELAFSWRHQVRALAAAGFHVLAPDQRGYGGSDKPPQIEAYTVAELSADVVGLLDEIGAEQAAMVGHDFGAVVAWAAPLLHPHRVPRGRRAEPAAGAAPAGADDAGVPPAFRGPLLLRPLLPAARTRGRRAGPRPGDHAAQAVRRAARR